jgi:hypothetical protein
MYMYQLHLIKWQEKIEIGLFGHLLDVVEYK